MQSLLCGGGTPEILEVRCSIWIYRTRPCPAEGSDAKRLDPRNPAFQRSFYDTISPKFGYHSTRIERSRWFWGNLPSSFDTVPSPVDWALPHAEGVSALQKRPKPQYRVPVNRVVIYCRSRRVLLPHQGHAGGCPPHLVLGRHWYKSKRHWLQAALVWISPTEMTQSYPTHRGRSFQLGLSSRFRSFAGLQVAGIESTVKGLDSPSTSPRLSDFLNLSSGETRPPRSDHFGSREAVGFRYWSIGPLPDFRLLPLSNMQPIDQ